jgi:hypothetical protein
MGKRKSPVIDQKPAALRAFRSHLRLGKIINGDRVRAMAINDLDEDLMEKKIKEFVIERASKGGRTTRDAYGADYFRWLSQRRKTKLGWPKGKLRKNRPALLALQTIAELNLDPAAKQMFKSMLSVCTQKDRK